MLSPLQRRMTMTSPFGFLRCRFSPTPLLLRPNAARLRRRLLPPPLLVVDLVSGVMASRRLLSTTLLRGLVRSSRASTSAAVSLPAIQQSMNYSSGLGGAPNANEDSMATRVAADHDTHQDFQPTSKSSDMSFSDIVAQDVKEHPVVIYMKGYPDAPRCGFSALAVKVLQQYGVPISARDILSDLKLKESVKAYSNWPTFPQIFIKGEFVGGSDIILTMHQKGELKELLGDIAQKDEQSGSS